MRGVEIGDAEAADQTFATQSVQMFHRVEIGGMLEAPPVKLQEVDGFDAEALAAALDALAHDLGRHRPRRRAPFGEGFDLAGRALHRPAGDEFRAAIVIGHVEGVEAALGIGQQGRRRRLAVQLAAAALHVGDLPEAGEEAGDREIGGKVYAGRVGHGGFVQHPRPEARAKRASKDAPTRALVGAAMHVAGCLYKQSVSWNTLRGSLRSRLRVRAGDDI